MARTTGFLVVTWVASVVALLPGEKTVMIWADVSTNNTENDNYA